MGSLRAMGRRNQIHPPSASGKTKLIQSAAPSTRGELNGYVDESFIASSPFTPMHIFLAFRPHAYKLYPFPVPTDVNSMSILRLR